MSSIFCIIFWTVIHIFIAVSCNTTFQPGKSRRIQRPKHFVKNNNNKDEDNSPKNNTKKRFHSCFFSGDVIRFMLSFFVSC